jgi:hypothetical protein
MNREERMDKEAEIHSLESSVKIWKEVSMPKFKASIEYFKKEIVNGKKEIARLETEIAKKKAALGE